MKSGHVFVDKEGVDIQRIKESKRNQVLEDYFLMRQRAAKNKDKFYSVSSKELEEFYSEAWSSDAPMWKGVSMNFVVAFSQGVFPLVALDDIADFDALPAPKSHGGFGYDNHPKMNYIHNSETWEKWHCDFYCDHPEEIDWSGTNGVMPCHEKVVDLLRQELLRHQGQIMKDGSLNWNLPYPKVLKLKNTDWKTANSETIVSEHNDIIIKHLGNRLKAYIEDLGATICCMNYYHREKELEALEKNHGNTKVSIIYSIKKSNRYQFLSIDTAHGKFELCDDAGNHLGEKRLDGSSNGSATVEADHGLRCVEEWKKRYH